MKLPVLHKNEYFENLCSQLENRGIIELVQSKKDKQIKIKNFELFLLLLTLAVLRRNVLSLYKLMGLRESESYVCSLKYNEGFLVTEIKFDEENKVILQHNVICQKEFRSLIQEILEQREEQEDNLINALFAVYLGSLHFWRAIYNNTYITEWKKEFAEFDVVALSEKPQPFCFIVETYCWTGRKNSESGPYHESRLRHLKRHLFDAWLIEKIFGIQSYFVYLDYGLCPARERHPINQFRPLNNLFMDKNNPLINSISLASYLFPSRRKTGYRFISWKNAKNAVKKVLGDLQKLISSIITANPEAFTKPTQ